MGSSKADPRTVNFLLELNENRRIVQVQCTDREGKSSISLISTIPVANMLALSQPYMSRQAARDWRMMESLQIVNK